MVVGNRRVVVDNVIPSPGETLVIGNVGSISGQTRIIEIAVFILVTLEIAFTIVGVTGREGCLEIKTLDDVELDVEVTQHAPCLALLAGALHHEQRVGLVRELIGSSSQSLIVTGFGIEFALTVFRNHEWVHSIGTLDGCIVGILVLGTGTVHTESCADNLVDFGIHTTLEVNAVLLITFVHTLLLIVTNTKVVVNALTATAHSEVVVLLATILCYEVGPVVGTTVQHLLHLVSTRAGSLTEQALLEDGTANLIDGMRRNLCLSRCKITCVAEELHKAEVVESLTVHEVRHAGRLRPSIVTVVTDCRLLITLNGRASLGSNHDDTGCSARSVDGC